MVGIERNPAEARVGNRELRVWRLTKKSENLRRRTGDDTERFASLVGDDKPNIRLIPDPLLHKAQAILLVSDARDDRVESFPPPGAAAVVDEAVGQSIDECLSVVLVQNGQRRGSRG